MGLYANWDHNNAHHQPSQADRLTWAASCGGRIKRACTLAGFSPRTAFGMRSIVAEFRNLGWVWNPAMGGRGPGSGRSWLDRAAAGAGECGYLAHALAELLMTPTPWGFGIARGQPDSPVARVYDGGPAANGWGFISDHNGVHHGLAANVCDPGNPLVLSPLYRWGDHVVVEYLGEFWDPSYNTRYAQLADMAAFTVVNAQVRIATNDIAMDVQPRGGGVPNVWFRFRKATDVGFNPQCQIVGPYAANPLPPLPDAVPAPPRRCCACIIL